MKCGGSDAALDAVAVASLRRQPRSLPLPWL